MKRAIAAGTFREDLYFRLNVIELAVPPLAERADDIAPLAQRILEDLAAASGTQLRLADDAMRALLDYDWPGNVRELQNKLQRASLVCSGGILRANDLALSASSPSSPPQHLQPKVAPAESSRPPAAVDVTERAQVQEALERARGVVSKAAAELGLSRQALCRKMERLSLTVTRRVGQ